MVFKPVNFVLIMNYFQHMLKIFSNEIVINMCRITLFKVNFKYVKNLINIIKQNKNKICIYEIFLIFIEFQWILLKFETMIFNENRIVVELRLFDQSDSKNLEY